MKQLSARLIGSLCVAAGSLAVVVPAQAIGGGGRFCAQSVTTTSTVLNPGYLDCQGPFEPPRLVFDGNPPGDPGNLAADFGKGPFVFKGYSDDMAGNPVVGGPFLNDPHGDMGTLFFRDLLTGLFVVALEGEAKSNYSYYLFDGGTVGALKVEYDTLGLSNAAGNGDPSPTLAFAGLYVQAGPQGGTIPEPTGLALLATAFGALALTARHRRS